MWLDCSVLIREVSSIQSVLYKEVPLYKYQEGRHGVSRGQKGKTQLMQHKLSNQLPLLLGVGMSHAAMLHNLTY